MPPPVQLPATHDWPAPQTLAHAPQFEAFDIVSTQAPPQVEKPAGHPHALFVHAWPPTHVFPQKPQLNGSVVMFAQLRPHCSRPVAQVAEHVPCEHKSPPVQTVPHAPQLFGSLIVLAQAMPHAESGAVHEHWPAVQLCPIPQA
jgi:hypothetical protein